MTTSTPLARSSFADDPTIPDVLRSVAGRLGASP
jgi:hypothetical protein